MTITPMDGRRSRPALIAVLLALTAAFAAPAAAAPTPVEPERDDQDAFITRAVQAGGAVWLLSDSGVVWRLARQPEAVVREALADQALDLCVRDGRLVVITGRRDGKGGWTLRQRQDDGWREIATVPSVDDTPVALNCDGQEVTLLTTRRLVDIGPGGLGVTAVSGLGRAGMAVTHKTADSLYVGFNVGEWGGGLRRIARATGVVRNIERKEGGGPCQEPLDSACDPVTGIVADPERPGCVVVAVGLVHMMSRGRLLRVCDDKVETTYIRALRNEPSSPEEEAYPDTVSFFGLASGGGGYWAAGINGVYRFDGPGAPAFSPMPKFHQVGPFRVSFDLPGLALVITEVNRRTSVSNGAPMLVPLEAGPLARDAPSP